MNNINNYNKDSEKVSQTIYSKYFFKIRESNDSLLSLSKYYKTESSILNLKDYDYFKEFMTLMETFYLSYIFQIPNYDMITLNDCGNTTVSKFKKQDIPIFFSPVEMAKFYLKLYFDMRKIEIKDNISNDKFNFLTSVCISKFERQADINFEKAICEAIGTFTKNVSTLPYREKSLVEGGPVKGPV